MVQNVRVTAKTQDRATGPGSRVRVTMAFRDANFPVQLAAENSDTVESAEAIIGHKLTDLRGWTFLYKKSPMSLDKTVALGEIVLIFTLKDGDKVEQVPVSVEPVRLMPNKEVVRGRDIALPSVEAPISANDRRRRFARLKCHLGSNKAAYRLAIDLVTSPIARAARLREDI